MNGLNGAVSVSERFEVSDLEFCSTCGTILPLATLNDDLMCKLCKKSIDITGNFAISSNISKLNH